jgi:hypothetical protein
VLAQRAMRPDEKGEYDYQYGVQLAFIRLGRRVENSYISNPSTVACATNVLNVNVFFRLRAVRQRRAVARSLQPGAAESGLGIRQKLESDRGASSGT